MLSILRRRWRTLQVSPRWLASSSSSRRLCSSSFDVFRPLLGSLGGSQWALPFPPLHLTQKEADEQAAGFQRCAGPVGGDVCHATASLPSQKLAFSRGLILDFARLARTAYSPRLSVRGLTNRHVRGQDSACTDVVPQQATWYYSWADSRNDPATGVHLHTWCNDGADVVITARGTQLPTASHVTGNIGLIRGSHFPAAIETRDLVLKLVEDLKRDGKRVWLVGHSRGAALMQFAGLGCSDVVEGIIAFESPGLPPWMLSAERPQRLSAFHDFYTYPNYITLLNPAINPQQRYQIPVAVAGTEGDDGMLHTIRCLTADANRLSNWFFVGSAVARAAARTSWPFGGPAHGPASLTLAASCARYLSAGGLWSALMVLQDFSAAHAIDGIVAWLAKPTSSQREGGGRLRRIKSWPSDHADRKELLTGLRVRYGLYWLYCFRFRPRN
eukprot:TRINITY_DN43897_c0_g1_i3.p1 TRINITY_DN43897_c0_g1~~TRINITY_DN43897_c0_g1_i3.p1  ORF type:complete len:454 (-),score=32.07 TRINITY_DN43897_c0_g1_i3:109-1437(-)